MKLWLIIFGAMILFSVIAAGMYMLVYSRIVNRCLKEPTERKRRIPVPRTVLAVLLVISCVVPLCGFAFDDKEPLSIEVTEVYSFGGLSINAEERQTSWASVFDPEENVGYKKEFELNKDGFTCTVFVTDGKMDDYHPYYLMFIDGEALDPDRYYFGYTTHVDYTVRFGGGTDSADIRELDCIAKDASGPILLYGDTTHNCVYTITLYLFDKTVYDALGVTDYNDALSSADTRVTFTVPMQGWHFQ